MAKRKKYNVGAWKGMPHYTCVKCNFDTLNEEMAKAHYEEKHTIKEVEKKIVPEWAIQKDRFGQPVKE